ncbi:MAG: hypothetical protein GMKNLPBB_03016 [Myxococcota bacterium]|nr:hypothetical protein [Myxococcota bacterium]
MTTFRKLTLSTLTALILLAPLPAAAQSAGGSLKAQAQGAFQKQDFRTAANLYERHLETDPGDDEARAAYAFALLLRNQQGTPAAKADAVQAEGQVRKALQGQQMPLFFIILGYTLKVQQRWDESLDATRLAEQMGGMEDQTLVLLHDLRGDAFAGKLMPGDAIHNWEIALAKAPSRTDIRDKINMVRNARNQASQPQAKPEPAPAPAPEKPPEQPPQKPEDDSSPGYFDTQRFRLEGDFLYGLTAPDAFMRAYGDLDWLVYGPFRAGALFYWQDSPVFALQALNSTTAEGDPAFPKESDMLLSGRLGFNAGSVLSLEASAGGSLGKKFLPALRITAQSDLTLGGTVIGFRYERWQGEKIPVAPPVRGPVSVIQNHANDPSPGLAPQAGASVVDGAANVLIPRLKFGANNVYLLFELPLSLLDDTLWKEGGVQWGFISRFGYDSWAFNLLIGFEYGNRLWNLEMLPMSHNRAIAIRTSLGFALTDFARLHFRFDYMGERFHFDEVLSTDITNNRIQFGGGLTFRF